MQIKRALVAMLGVAAIATSLHAGPAAASEGPSASVGTLSAAVEGLEETSSLVSEADATSSAATIATDAQAGVTLNVPGHPGVEVGIPNADRADQGVRQADGSVIFPSEDQTASTVIPTESGVQVLTTITGSAAPENYRHSLGLAADQVLSLTEDGGAQVTNAEGEVVVTIAAPWAKDANGNDVETFYTVNGDDLTQVVNHVNASVTYPIVADPTYKYWWGGKKSFTNAKSTRAAVISGMTSLVPGFAVAAALTAGVISLCNSKGKGIWVYWTWAGHTWCKSR